MDYFSLIINREGEKMKNKKKTIFTLLGVFFTCVCLACFIFFGHSLIQVNIVPTKYLILCFGILSVVFFLLIFFLFVKEGLLSKILIVTMMSALSLLLVFASSYFHQTTQFFSGTKTKDYDTLTYSVFVLKNQEYKSLTDLKNLSIGYLEHDSETIQKELQEKITYQEKKASDIGELVDSLFDKKLQAICLEEGHLFLLREEIDNFEQDIQMIYTFQVRVDGTSENAGVQDVSNSSFVLYISGIDQYGNVNSVRGRSDVNQIAVVNTRTNHILLVNTPRDYYVQLAGTTGLKDKLTHAGIYGINKSIATLENLYKIDIEYYLRVNFDTLIKVVDIIGGIDIYSDATFTCWTNKNVHVNTGWNHFNGAQALAYSRERHAYLTGDHHRGANQQQVITAIIHKMTQSSVLINKYSSILNAMDGSFQTNLPTPMLTSFIKYQLDEMPVWNVESIAVTGQNSMDYTYSMGTSQKLYVMEPDYSSVTNAISKIKAVYNEK